MEYSIDLDLTIDDQQEIAATIAVHLARILSDINYQHTELSERIFGAIAALTTRRLPVTITVNTNFKIQNNTILKL